MMVDSEILENGVRVADIPALPLTDGCPTYEREGVESELVRELREQDLSEFLAPEGDLTGFTSAAFISSPNIASKRWIYDQYDTTVRTSTVVSPGGDAGVIRSGHSPGDRGDHRLQRSLLLP
jgi:phosphoribosylformylglycinamidine synthase subunit PurL